MGMGKQLLYDNGLLIGGQMPDLLMLKPHAAQPHEVAVDALQLIADAVICTDEFGRILLFNRAAEQSFGYSANEVIGKHVEMLLPVAERLYHSRQVRSFAQEKGDTSRLMGQRREVVGLHKSGTEFPTEAIVSRHLVSGSPVLTAVHRDITERKKLEERREVIAQELDHRIKNVLSVVLSVVSLSANNASNVPEFKELLLRRIHMLARTQGVLRAGADTSTDLKELLLDEIASFRTSDGSNIIIIGPSISIGAQSAQALALIFHELATNSAKYGALSNANGRLIITFRRDGERSADDVIIEWSEAGGPPATAPDHLGFGTKLITNVINSAFGTDVMIKYPTSGLICQMTLPVARLQE